MHAIGGGVCAICGERLFSSDAVAGAAGEPRCGLCRRIEPPFARAAAYGSYESGLRELIHLLKYGGVRPAATVLGRMLAEAIATLEQELPADSVPVVPVPLHRTKLRQRGFNQAEGIARAAMKMRPRADRLHLCGSARKKARHRIANWSYQPPAPRESERCLCSRARVGERPRSAGGGRRLHQRRHRFGVHTRLAPSWRYQSLGRDRGAYAENLSAARGHRTRCRR